MELIRAFLLFLADETYAASYGKRKFHPDSFVFSPLVREAGYRRWLSARTVRFVQADAGG
ncbi:hypothetical protein [Paenibacillus sp. R14(2021)]|uniref:hypothetical protein n=1 Tax=Paenibacillus sp. R14(2021) TaxID=2859228 RepID=UPI001C612153|nr:hypothetical protein [Paenibacillus sp. R14(2021)]